MSYERLESVAQQLVLTHTQLEGIAAVLTSDELAGGGPEERSTRRELCIAALQLLEDTEAAIGAGKPVEVLTALVNAANGLAGQLRDRVLDQAVESSPPPDPWLL